MAHLRPPQAHTRCPRVRPLPTTSTLSLPRLAAVPHRRMMRGMAQSSLLSRRLRLGPLKMSAPWKASPRLPVCTLGRPHLAPVPPLPTTPAMAPSSRRPPLPMARRTLLSPARLPRPGQQRQQCLTRSWRGRPSPRLRAAGLPRWMTRVTGRWCRAISPTGRLRRTRKRSARRLALRGRAAALQAKMMRATGRLSRYTIPTQWPR